MFSKLRALIAKMHTLFAASYWVVLSAIVLAMFVKLLVICYFAKQP